AQVVEIARPELSPPIQEAVARPSWVCRIRPRGSSVLRPLGEDFWGFGSPGSRSWWCSSSWSLSPPHANVGRLDHFRQGRPHEVAKRIQLSRDPSRWLARLSCRWMCFMQAATSFSNTPRRGRSGGTKLSQQLLQVPAETWCILPSLIELCKRR